MGEQKDFDRLYEIEQEMSPFTKPGVGIQWKGTDICGDFHCKCGAHGHVDDYFCYYYRCSQCDALYALPHWIGLREVEGEHLELYNRLGYESVTRTDPDAD